MKEAKRLGGIFLCGALFAIGLVVSGMTNPAKVVGFLDVLGGDWDPSLAFVMLGAIGIHFFGYRFVTRRGKPVWDAKFHVPAKIAVDKPLVVGALFFGVGWGISGFCPGPAIANGLVIVPEAALFIAAMFLGSLVVAPPR